KRYEPWERSCHWGGHGRERATAPDYANRIRVAALRLLLPSPVIRMHLLTFDRRPSRPDTRSLPQAHYDHRHTAPANGRHQSPRGGATGISATPFTKRTTGLHLRTAPGPAHPPRGYGHIVSEMRTPRLNTEPPVLGGKHCCSPKGTIVMTWRSRPTMQ